MEELDNVVSITGYRTEGSETFENVSDEKIKLIYEILNSKEDITLFGTNIKNFELGTKVDKSNATIIEPSQLTISINGNKKTINV